MNKNKSKEDLLIEYIKEGDIGNFAELLLKDPNINVNHPDKNYGRTALICASFIGNSECVELLLKHPNINVNHADIEGFTALMRASSKGHTECVDVSYADIYGTCYFDLI